MGDTHKVVQGEHFAAIAARKGHGDFRPLWDASENKTINDKRKTPHMLLPGDEVFVPPVENKDETAPTTKRTKFKATGVPLKLILEVRTDSNDPAKKAPCDLTVESTQKVEDLDNSGRVTRPVPLTAAKGRLVVRDANLPVAIEADLEIGGLHPLDTVTGQIQRLNNLGYDAGKVAEPTSADDKFRFKSAVEEFQCEHGLKVDGVLGDGTRSKLKDVYGC
ncbi:MAG: hypothetical protein HBSAPP03_07750 [Phycisphaerae bacterium]|nr:MAG: hypothetical protein HBSAPP03_07750 [Phycisphaerae bacterium]